MALERKTTIKATMERAYADGGVGAINSSSSFWIPAFVEVKPEMTMDKFDQNFYNSSLGRPYFLTGKAYYKANLKYYLKGTFAAIDNVLPEWHPLMQAAGLAWDTASVFTSLHPSDTIENRRLTTSSVALDLNLDGVRYIISGARAESTKFTLEAGQPATVEHSFIGLYTEPTSQSCPTPVYRDYSIVPQIVSSISFTIGSDVYDIPSITYELKNQIVEVDSVNALNRGIKEFAIVGREYGGTLKVKVDDVNKIKLWQNMFASVEVAMYFLNIGSVAGNRILLNSQAMQIEEVRPVAQNGLNYYDVKFRLNTVSANPYQELYLTIT